MTHIHVSRCRIGSFYIIISLLALFLLPGGAGGLEKVRDASLKPGDPIPPPMGKVLLEVTGALAKPNKDGRLLFDRAILEKLGVIRYPNKNKWYTKEVVFEGVLMQVLLDAVGVPEGSVKVRMKALDDFQSDAPLEDFKKWPVMLALKMNGEYMSIKNKGPIWVGYPTHIDPEVGMPAFQAKWVWQLNELVIMK